MNKRMLGGREGGRGAKKEVRRENKEGKTEKHELGEEHSKISMIIYTSRFINVEIKVISLRSK